MSERMVKNLCEMVSISSESGEEKEFIDFLKTKPQHPPLEIVITREEEIGFAGAKNLDYSLISAKRGVLVDMDALDSIMIGGPSHILIGIEITGKGAHSGMEPEKGIAAIKAASLAIETLKDGRIDPETTANFGIIQGGLIRNSVPEKCTIKAEVRSLNHEKCIIALSNTYKEAFEVIAHSIGAKAEVILNLAYNATRISEDGPHGSGRKERFEECWD